MLLNRARSLGLAAGSSGARHPGHSLLRHQCHRRRLRENLCKSWAGLNCHALRSHAPRSVRLNCASSAARGRVLQDAAEHRCKRGGPSPARRRRQGAAGAGGRAAGRLAARTTTAHDGRPTTDDDDNGPTDRPNDRPSTERGQRVWPSETQIRPTLDSIVPIIGIDSACRLVRKYQSGGQEQPQALDRC